MTDLVRHLLDVSKLPAGGAAGCLAENTPLWRAAMAGQVNVVRLLLDNEAPVLAAAHGRTLLMAVCEAGFCGCACDPH